MKERETPPHNVSPLLLEAYKKLYVRIFTGLSVTQFANQEIGFIDSYVRENAPDFSQVLERFNLLAKDPEEFQELRQGIEAILTPSVTKERTGLKDWERKVLDCLYGLSDRQGKTLRGAADDLGLSRGRIWQIEQLAVGKLRRFPNRNRLIELLK